MYIESSNRSARSLSGRSSDYWLVPLKHTSSCLTLSGCYSSSSKRSLNICLQWTELKMWSGEGMYFLSASSLSRCGDISLQWLIHLFPPFPPIFNSTEIPLAVIKKLGVNRGSVSLCLWNWELFPMYKTLSFFPLRGTDLLRTDDSCLSCKLCS